MPHLSSRIPDPRKNAAGDFPSEHSKRSQIKLEPLEQRRFKSTESRPISTSSYLTESVERHREMEASRLKDYLKAKESDANQPWNKPGWPGPKKTNNDESLRELETMKQPPQASPISPGESGWLIKMRKNRYLNEASKSNEPKRYRSMDQLHTPAKEEDPTATPHGSDPLHWQLRKEFHLTKYTERRSSYHVESTSSSHHHPPPVRADRAPPSPPPLPPTQITVVRPTPLNKPLSKSQQLYPPGSTEDIASERKPAIRPPEKTVYENQPIPPAALNVQERRPAPTKPNEIDYPERLMSPPPTHQPRSILKGYSSSQQYYSQTNLSETTLTPQQMHPRQSERRTPTHFEELDEEEKTRIMMENLQRHRNMRSGPHGPREAPPTASFNGPFFRLEQVSPAPGQPTRSHSVDPTRDGESLHRMREISASEIELNQHNFHRQDPSVVIWPPVTEKERKRPNSVLARNLNDPERIEEYQRQKRLEQEAIQRHEEQQLISMSKQIRAMEIQQQRLYEQSHGVISPVPILDSVSPYSHQSQQPPQQHHQQQHVPPPPPPPPQQQQLQQPPYYSSQQPQSAHDPGNAPQHVQVFETRPISAMSDAIDPRGDAVSPPNVTWKRTYIVEKPKDIAKNEILTSEELLEKEQYEVDLLKRRETFVEKPVEPPRVHRTGKRWQPPPEKPYVWPTVQRAASVDPQQRYDDGDEYKWAPVVNDPGFKREEKNFTPLSSPPLSPRRGHGTGPLDDPAKRQTRYVIHPSADGSHRPKPAFKKERATPSGGFYPHAPNAIKVVKKRAQSVQGLLSPASSEHVEIIHQRNYHRLDYENGNHSKLRHHGSDQELHHHRDEVQDWEKIYELPPHSSQIVQKDMPRHVDVQRRLSKFEGSIQNLRAASSQRDLDTSNHLQFPSPDYDNKGSRYRHAQPQMSRRNSVASTRIDSPSMAQHQHRQQQSSRAESRGMSRAASSILLSPQPAGPPPQRPTTPGASKARNYIARATAPSPTPLSYERARTYVPPPLPPGYRLTDPAPDPRATSPSPGHTRKMMRNMSESTQRLHPNTTPQGSRAPSRHSRHSPNPRFL
ncbi:unnamed protein product [Caenorhabditis bovis]|uniref:Uncharacterized protein n=1 Tax=Caenorhabditis bovis TaxID=2654633 RepID=A0A8S1EUG8_9PELO|nr:unnamed protein product [Caenorhabditis bovis]